MTIAGKLLQEKKTLGSYLIQPDSVLTVTLSKCLTENSRKPTVEDIGGNIHTPKRLKYTLFLDFNTIISGVTVKMRASFHKCALPKCESIVLRLLQPSPRNFRGRNQMLQS